jgi:hypothetical protein
MALELNGTTGVSLVQDGIITAADLASGAITSSALPAGSVLQVVHATTTTEVTLSNNTETDTTLTATITPSSTSSKILILVNHPTNQKGNANSGNRGIFKLYRDSTELVVGADGVGYTAAANYLRHSTSFQWYDSPSTTSAVTYKTTCKNAENASYYIVQQGNSTSMITLMEIAQ